MEKDGTMKYNNKLELIDAIKSNADLFIREYSDIKDEFMDTTYEEIEYSPYQMLAFCIGWMDLVLSWEEEEQNGIQKTVLATEWKWNDLDWLYQSFYDRYKKFSLKELVDNFNQKIDSIIQLINNLSDEDLFNEGRRDWLRQMVKNLVCAD